MPSAMERTIRGRAAIIPARGGSTRIPRKNIREFCGKPMIAWSIEAAKASGVFDRIIVSTDDEEIAATARRHGAEIPFVRPAELADDTTATRDVIVHAIRTLAEAADPPEIVCCLYPTAPFVRIDDLRGALHRLETEGADFAFSVTSFPYPIQRALRIGEDGGLSMFWPEHRWTRSQDLSDAYHDAGQFYWGRTQAYLERRDAFASGSIPIVLPRFRVHDIDTEEDWERAELVFRALGFADGKMPR